MYRCVCMYGCMVVCVCIYMYVDMCAFVCVLYWLYVYIKNVLKIIHKVVSHHMYIIDILVCGTYDNFQDKNHLDICFFHVEDFVCFFCASVNVSVYVTLCECFVCVFYVDIMFIYIYIF
jgi:hypothetical protein